MSKNNIYLDEGELMILKLLVNQGTFKGEAAQLVVDLISKLDKALEPFQSNNNIEEN